MGQSSRANWFSLIAAAGIGLLVILAITSHRGGTSVPTSKNGSSVNQGRPRGDCVGVVVAASSEKAAVMADFATSYNATNPKQAGRCVDVRVFSKASGGAEQALARGWDDQRDGGPQPTVWSPASSGWAGLLQQATTAGDRPNLVPSSYQHVAQTPLTIAMPKPMAQALGWPDKPIGWGDVLGLANDPAGWGKYGHPEWGPFRLGKTDPELSTSGLNALVGTYFAATGLSNDLSTTRVEDPKTVQYVSGIEQSVVHYGDTTLTFLANLQKADDRGAALGYISAVAVEEKSVWDYNHGNPSGDPATLNKHNAPRVPLVAIYPKEGTLISDSPFIPLTAPWVTGDQRAAANDFLAYIQQSAQQSRFAALAFRDYQGKAGDQITAQNGLIPSQPSIVLKPPAPAVLAQIQADWQKLRKKARVLVEVDVSGSMGEMVAGTDKTKLDLVKTAVTNSLGQFSGDDSVQVDTFTTDTNGRPSFTVVVPFGPVSQNRGTITAKVNALVPEQGTPLYNAARHDVALMRQSYDPSRINAIMLLTDGKNEYSGDTDLAGLVHDLRRDSEERNIRVFTIAYGQDADLDALKQISEASQGAAYNAKDAASIDKVFTSVISNF